MNISDIVHVLNHTVFNTTSNMSVILPTFENDSTSKREEFQLNCTEIDNIHDDIIFHIASDNRTFYAVLASAISVVSVMLIVFGEKIMRVTVAVICASTGFVIGFYFTQYINLFTCEVRLLTGAGLAVAFAAIALLAMKVGLFVVGAAAFGSFAHFV